MRVILKVVAALLLLVFLVGLALSSVGLAAVALVLFLADAFVVTAMDANAGRSS